MIKPAFIGQRLEALEIPFEHSPERDMLRFTLPFQLLEKRGKKVFDTAMFNNRLDVWINAPFGDYAQYEPSAYRAATRLARIAGLDSIIIARSPFDISTITTFGGNGVEVREGILDIADSQALLNRFREVHFYNTSLSRTAS